MEATVSMTPFENIYQLEILFPDLIDMLIKGTFIVYLDMHLKNEVASNAYPQDKSKSNSAAFINTAVIFELSFRFFLSFKYHQVLEFEAGHCMELGYW